MNLYQAFKQNSRKCGSIAILCFMLISCKKNKDNPVSGEDYSHIDLSIDFNRYGADSLYTTDTIQNEFRIINHSDKAIKAGNKIMVACALNGRLFNLDLTAPEASPITLAKDLNAGESLVYNPGYLLGNDLLTYFGKDTVTVGIMVYGINTSLMDSTFANDPQPGNNRAVLDYSVNGIRLAP